MRDPRPGYGNRMSEQQWLTDWHVLMDTQLTGFEQGECYTNAARFVMDKGKGGSYEGSPLLLCHGDVRGEDGTYHGHAWVEWGDGIPLVLDPSNGTPQALIMSSPSYYHIGRIDPEQVVRYDQNQLRKMVLETEDYGPWEVGR